MELKRKIINIFVSENFFVVDNLIEVVGIPSIIIALLASIIVLVVDLIQEIHPQTSFIEKTKKWKLIFQWAAFIGLIVCIVWFGYYGSGLPRFEFGYMRF